jgi:hypothetical protein
MHSPLLVVIVSFGLIFVVTAALALRLSLTRKSDASRTAPTAPMPPNR